MTLSPPRFVSADLEQKNERRDRETKLKLYARRPVLEYWVVDWRKQQIEVFRHEQATLKQVTALSASDDLSSPLLPGFACRVGALFAMPL